jgi:hypothetical protein
VIDLFGNCDALAKVRQGLSKLPAGSQDLAEECQEESLSGAPIDLPGQGECSLAGGDSRGDTGASHQRRDFEDLSRDGGQHENASESLAIAELREEGCRAASGSFRTDEIAAERLRHGEQIERFRDPAAVP